MRAVSFRRGPTKRRTARRPWDFRSSNPVSRSTLFFKTVIDVGEMKPASGGLTSLAGLFEVRAHPAGPETCSRCRSIVLPEVGVVYLAQSRAHMRRASSKRTPARSRMQGLVGGFPPFAPTAPLGSIGKVTKRHFPELPAPTKNLRASCIYPAS